MASAMKTVVFIISLIAYFIYSIISSGFIRAVTGSGNLLYATLAAYIISGLGILVILYAQACAKYYYASRHLKNSKIYVQVPLGQFRFTDRLSAYLLPAVYILYPVAQTRSLSSVTLPSAVFFAVVVLVIELLFYINSKTTKAYITDKGIVIRGMDLRLELPFPSNYRNPSGFFPFERIINFLDLNDRLTIEQSYDLGSIILKGDTDTLKQIKAVLLANKVLQKKF